MCVCFGDIASVCFGDRERERERERDGQKKQRKIFDLKLDIQILACAMERISKLRLKLRQLQK